MAKIFTKKIALIMLTALIAVSGVIWAIVANLQPKFKPGIYAIPEGRYVSGNGTASVLVDNYLYFIGDSIATSSIQYGDNEYYAKGKMPDTGIFRVKIEDGQPVLDFEYDNNSKNDAGEKIELQEGDEGYNTKVVAVKDWDNIGDKDNGIEAVVPKIAGHDQSAMWVFGNNLIYVSPHNRLDNRGNLLKDYLDFFRVDLDGKNHTLIYTTSSANLTTADFTVWADSTDNIYLVVHETADQEIKTINVKTKAVTTLDEKVENVVLPMAGQYRTNTTNETLEKVYGGAMSYVYYTKNRDTEKDQNQGNLMYRHAIDGGEPEKIGDDGSQREGTTFTPLAVTPAQNGKTQFVFSVVVKNNNDVKLTEDKLCLINETNLADYKYTEPSETLGLQDGYTVKVYANGFCTINDDLRYYTVINGSEIVLQPEVLMTGVEKVLTVMGDTIYVQKGTVVHQIKVGQSAHTISIVPEDDTAATPDDGTEEDTTETNDDTLQLPVAVLYQPHGDNGDPMVFAHDANHIRLYTNNGKFNYIKFKTAKN